MRTNPVRWASIWPGRNMVMKAAKKTFELLINFAAACCKIDRPRGTAPAARPVRSSLHPRRFLGTSPAMQPRRHGSRERHSRLEDCRSRR
jgi:hypothetical protein